MEQTKQNRDRSLEELRHDINTKAKTMYEDGSDATSVIIFMIILYVVFEGLNLYFGWYSHHLLIGCMFALFAFWTISSILVIGHQFKKMTKAVDVRQHQREAKRFVWCYQLEKVLSFPIAFFVVSMIMGGGSRWFDILMASLLISAFYLVWLLFKHDSYINTDFYNDVQELNEYKTED